MKIYEFKYKYQIEKNYKNGFDYEAIKELWTDYFDDYDYILGDWSYGKLRLKGYCDKNNKKYKNINDIKNIDDYIKKNCAYDCSYFILKKIKE
ncbi:MAG: YutD family protein [Bacilli bacterium]|nr:YutD family protein [Bacilli bacterium]